MQGKPLVAVLILGTGLLAAGSLFYPKPAHACGTAEMVADGFYRAEDNGERTRMLEVLIAGCEFYASKPFEPRLLDILNASARHGLPRDLIQEAFDAYRCVPSAFVDYRPGNFSSEDYKALSVLLDFDACPERADLANWRVITADAVNFRAAPSIDGDRLGQFRDGAIVEFVERQGAWTKITADNGQTGYVHGDFVAPYLARDTSQAAPLGRGQRALKLKAPMTDRLLAGSHSIVRPVAGCRHNARSMHLPHV